MRDLFPAFGAGSDKRLDASAKLPAAFGRPCRRLIAEAAVDERSEPSFATPGIEYPRS